MTEIDGYKIDVGEGAEVLTVFNRKSRRFIVAVYLTTWKKRRSVHVRELEKRRDGIWRHTKRGWTISEEGQLDDLLAAIDGVDWAEVESKLARHKRDERALAISRKWI